MFTGGITVPELLDTITITWIPGHAEIEGNERARP
jgi:ribonuclease HI